MKFEEPATNGHLPGPCLYVAGEREPLTAARVAALRQWLAAGGHNAPEVADEVARRMLESGDL